MCEQCFGDGACERQALDAAATPATPPAELAGVKRAELEREVAAHRLRWSLLMSANALRLEVHAAAEATKDLPAPQTLPYIRANDLRLQAVKAAFASDADVLRILTRILAQWPAFQKSG